MKSRTIQNYETFPGHTPSQIWEQIKGKADLYATAAFGSAGNFPDTPLYVRIAGVVSPGTFRIQHPVFGPMNAGCYELTNYGL